MARKPNYGFEKHLKQQKAQQKKEAKLEKKRLRREEAAQEDRTGERADTDRGYTTGG